MVWLVVFYRVRAYFFRLFACILLTSFYFSASSQQSALSAEGLSIIPYPKEVTLTGNEFVLDQNTSIVLPRKTSSGDQFSGNELVEFFNGLLGSKLNINRASKGKAIYLSRQASGKKIGKEGYTLTVDKDAIRINAASEAGIFYAIQTLKQLVQKKDNTYIVKGISVTDWPDTKVRAVHYDTKHHQDTYEFVQSFIRDLAKYKINMLVWEWEDKFEYPSHPELGAPGAFTMKEMQQLTLYAKKYHIQIVPLVQGLGHAGFILKWPQFANLREVPASNFEFCPLKEQSYQLLYDLWRDAMAATPGAEYVHIGSDETYELGKCPDCKRKESEIGRSGLYHLFVGKGAAFIQREGREAMAWEAPMGWAKDRLKVYDKDMKQDQAVIPQKGLILTESYDYETPDLKYAKQAKTLGYPIYAYDPNPGIEQLFLPYFFTKNGDGQIVKGSLENSYDFLKMNLGKNVFDGVIRTSWDDSGLPMQAWMLCFATTAAYGWNASAPTMEEFTATFYKNRYGNNAKEIDTLYHLLNEAAYFYMESFERRVWAWGEIGKTHLPDLPRGDALEYDPFWNSRYADRLKASNEFLAKMNRAVLICEQNIANKVDNTYDIEVFKTLAELARHTALTYLDLSALEDAIRQAHENRFTDLPKAYEWLQTATKIVSGQLQRRDKVFNDLVNVWNRTRLEKGMSTPTKKYFFEQERTRHFANRVPDMSYLIVDEQKLNLENYLVQLQQYTTDFKDRFITPGNKN